MSDTRPLLIFQAKVTTTMEILEATGAEKAQWESEKAALQSSVAFGVPTLMRHDADCSSEVDELKKVIAANDRGLAAFVPNASAGVMPSIAEERSMDGSSYANGKRMREE